MRRDVVDRLADGRDLLGVLVRDLDPELVLELHDQLDEVERVGVEVLLERRLLGDVRLFDPELLGQDFLDSLEDFLARRCHVTSFTWGPGKTNAAKSRRSYNPGGLGQPRTEPTDDIVLDAAGGEPDRVRDRGARRVAVRDDREAAEPEQVGATIGV